MAYTVFAEPVGTSKATAGKDYLLYVNTGTTEAAPTWTLVGGQRSGDLSRKADEIDASDKTSGGWKATLPGLRSWSIDLESVYLAGDTGAKFLEAAFLNNKQVNIDSHRHPQRRYHQNRILTLGYPMGYPSSPRDEGSSSTLRY